MPRPNNLQIAEMLEQVAQLLEIKEADAFRVAAYRRAARAVSEARQPLWQVFVTQGIDGLRRIPGVGPTIGSAIQQFLETGSVGMLERLKSEVPPEHLFTMVPGILARSVPRTRAATAAPAVEVPPVELILEVDAGYRRGAQSGQLRRIAPRRFNPEAKAWLPLLQTIHQGWSFTALFSNTARAHELGMTRDWVVIFYERGQQVGQCTVVTERRGLMAGKRVVRGREAECRSLYFLRPASSAGSPEQFPPGGAGPLAAAG